MEYAKGDMDDWHLLEKACTFYSGRNQIYHENAKLDNMVWWQMRLDMMTRRWIF